MSTNTDATTGIPAQRASTADKPRKPGKEQRFADGGGVLNVFSHGFLALWAVLIIGPLVWIILGSFKNNKEIGDSAWSWPSHWGFGAFSRAWDKGIGDFFLNTLIVLAGSLTLTMLLGSMAAYVLARYEFRGNRIIFYFFVAGAMFPVYLALVPLFFMMKNLGTVIPWLGLNQYAGLILVYTAYSLPFTVFFLHSFFRSLPSAVHEAAMIDGCSHTRAFFQVMVPMAKSGLISVFIFNVLGQWNQYLLPLTLMQQKSSSDPDHSMLAQGLMNLAQQSGYASDFPGLFAGMTIAMLPVLVVYLSFQRQVQAGLTSATLK
ncbi:MULTISPECIES: carbohydrate ABC transporter permease [Kitasatospora]|uniref:Putative chitobiose ABC transporter permease protein n=1 Tax=Kitasatospora setae (strain ATCC 33774 / DSM 43861 / JCM 3304 / KCC A-0304 / NBRC 14216 / KM-6054) TaxID=452652 RepID=E4NB70_KITSK|nr:MULTISPECIES: carbohydrate ABC transporter permease [Kitasatospora]BAJ28451.1 putative chitobiose ABC transporter permease protein [Kitasatospora setae KM-6054]